jgi:hypothetical protein
MRQRDRWLLGLALIACGCGDDVTNVGGTWCGRAVATAEECVGGGEGEYMVLTQSDNRVSGRVCDEYENDCNQLQAGEVSETRLSLLYEFSGFRVVGVFDAEGPNTLVGSFHSTKCACDVQRTFSRVP